MEQPCPHSLMGPCSMSSPSHSGEQLFFKSDFWLPLTVCTANIQLSQPLFLLSLTITTNPHHLLLSPLLFLSPFPTGK